MTETASHSARECPPGAAQARTRTKIEILTGRAVPLAGGAALSGIAKTPVQGPVWLGREGIDGDEQADRRLHGGPDKAVHYYPRDHYGAWQDALGCLPLLGAAGAFGENLSGTGMTEREVAVGDVFRLGGALLQVSQGRQPCWKLNRRFGLPAVAQQVQQTGRTGWYFRVLEPGRVAPGARLELTGRAAPDWPLHRLWHALFVDRMNLSELRAIAALDVLAEGWRKTAARRVSYGRVEDWRPRLEGGT